MSRSQVSGCDGTVTCLQYHPLMRCLLIALVLAVGLDLGCGEEQLPSEERAMGATCEADVQCASRVCIGGGRCPDGAEFGAFCGGEPCQAGDCGIGEKCVTLQREGGAALHVCVTTTRCN